MCWKIPQCRLSPFRTSAVSPHFSALARLKLVRNDGEGGGGGEGQTGSSPFGRQRGYRQATPVSEPEDELVGGVAGVSQGG